MRNRHRVFCFFVFFLSISLFLFPTFALCYNTNKGGHREFSDKAIQLKKTKDPQLKKQLDLNEKTIKDATAAEDSPFTKTRKHFYNPATGKGLLYYFKNAKERAEKFYTSAVNSYCSGNKQKGWDLLGHALHLLQDMGSPPHVYNATHAFQKFKQTWGYENYVSNNWPELEKQIVAEDCELSGGIDHYIHEMALYTYSHYPKHDWELIIPQVPPLPPIYIPVPVTTGEDPYPDGPYNTVALLNKVVCYSAGLIDTFWNDVYVNKCSPIISQYRPGGDHADDRFDVSIPLEFGIDEAEYQWINMRLAMKKGRIGYYWAYLFGNKFQEIYNLPSDTSDEIIAQKFIELKDLETLLINYPYNETDDTNAAPDIAVLSNGYAEEAVRLLFKQKETARLVEPQFAIDELKNQPVLFIPSGGLFGLENSQMLKAQLDEYVKNGGTLIVFAQQHGYEFSILPVPQEADGTYKTITGYGWTEDQSCLWNGTYVDTWHQIFSGIYTSTPSANVDGYFTDYPSSATVLLRRIKNGQPAMLMYEYGNERVIVSSLFTDWGYAHSQATQDELKIVRDMISWAKKPEHLPEIKPGETVSVSVTVTNHMSADASSLKFYIYNPDRTQLLLEQAVTTTIPPGQSAIFPVSHTPTPRPPLGIYHIDYALLDIDGKIIQPQAETDSGRFVVSSPSSNPYKSPDFSFSIQSDAEQYLYSSPITFTVNAWNRTDLNRTITLKYSLPALAINGTRTFEVKAKSSTSFNFVIPEVKIYNWVVWLIGSFYDEAGNYLGYAERKGMWVYYPSVNVIARTDKSLYAKGENVIIDTSLINNIPLSWQANLKISIIDSRNTKVFEDTKTIALAPSGTGSLSTSFTLPTTLTTGTYYVKVETWHGTGLLSSAFMSFELPQSQISVTPNLPSTLISGTNNIPFNITNTGKVSVSSGSIDISLKDPDRGIAYSGTHPFTIAVGESKVLNIPITIPPLKFGSYTLTYSQSDETRKGRPVSVTILNSGTINIYLDKPIYKIGDTANITITINNTGKFRQEGILTIDIPSLGFTDSKPVTVNPSEAATIPYSIPLPVALSSGGTVNATFITSSGNQLTKTLPLPIAPIVINQNIVFDKSSYRTRENIGMNYSVTNNSNFVSPLNAVFNFSIPDLRYSYNSSLILEPGKSIEIPFSIIIPETVSAGPHQVLTSLTLPSGAIHTGSFGFTLPESSIIPVYSGPANLSAGDIVTIDVTNTGGVDTDLTCRMILTGNGVTVYKNILNDTILGGETKNYSFQISNQAVNGVYRLYAELLDIGTNRKTYLNKELTISGIAAGLLVKTEKDIYLSTEGIAALSQILNKAYAIENGNLHMKVINKCVWRELASYHIFTWDGESWIERGVLHYPGTLDTRSIDLSTYLPDASGEYKIRIRHQGQDNAEIDYISLMADDVACTPTFAVNWSYEMDILDEIIEIDGLTAYVLNSEVEVRWSGIPASTNEILLMGAKEGIEYCQERTYWEEYIPVTQPADTKVEISRIVGPLWTTGQLYLQGRLLSSTGQVIGEAEYPFNVIDGDIALRIQMDKPIYRPDETMSITGVVNNLAPIVASEIKVEIFDENRQSIYSNTFNIPAEGSQNFTFTRTAGSDGVYQIYGEVYQESSLLSSVKEVYEVATPILTASVDPLSTVGNTPFNLNIAINNTGKIPGSVQLSASGGPLSDTKSLIIQPGEIKLLQYSQQIANTTIYTFTFTGDLEQAIQKEVIFGEKAEIQLNIQSVYKEGEITIPYTLKNTGVLEGVYPVTFTSFRDGQETSKITRTFFLPIGGSSSDFISYNLSEGMYTLRYETTGFQAEAVINVARSGQGEISLSVNAMYPEGTITIPYTIRNTGTFDEEFTVKFELGTTSISRTVFIPAWGSYINELQYSLPSGNYTISATVTSYPSSPVSRSFLVLKENNVTVDVTVGAQDNGLIPVTVNLLNTGYNEISGSVSVSISPSTGPGIWNASQDVSLPYSLIPTGYTLTFNINPSAIQTGDYTLRAELLSHSGQQLAASSQQLTINGPLFQITQLPPYQTFTAGQEATFTFMVKNKGNQEGAFDFNFRAYDLVDSTQHELLMPGGEKAITFSFMLPEDLEEKDYYAEYRLGDSPDSTALQSGKSGTVPTKGQVKYRITGINLNVNASLDKQYYRAGDTARLTIVAGQSSFGTLNLLSRVNYSGYESQQSFTLSSTKTLTFDVPLTEITGEKLFYGIYHESGRSIHLNSLYIHKIGGTITITTNKQVYNPGETVIIAISSQQSAVSGTLTLSALNYEETFPFTGNATRSFALPSTMTAGTYNVSYQLSAVSGETYAGTHPFDVAGISIKVKEATLDKGKYASTDTLNLRLTIESNRDMGATLKAWIVDPEGKYTVSGESNINLTSSENLLITHTSSLIPHHSYLITRYWCEWNPPARLWNLCSIQRSAVSCQRTSSRFRL